MEVLIPKREQLVKKSSDGKKTVFLRRIDERFILASKVNTGGKDILDTANISLASFTDKNLGGVFRPLSTLEEKYIMPKLIGVEYGTVDFYDKVVEYYANMETSVDSEGVQLNIGTQVVKTKEGTDILMPDSPIDWLTYRLALEHFKVAASGSEIDIESNPNAIFYIDDSAEKSDKEFVSFKLKQEAQKKWLDLTYGETLSEESKAKLNYAFRLLKDVHRKSLRDVVTDGKIDDKKLMTVVGEVVETKPQDFINVIDDKDIAERALLGRAVEAGVITKVGNEYFDNQESMGDTEEKAILYMLSPTRGTYKNELKARIKEKEKLNR